MKGSSDESRIQREGLEDLKLKHYPQGMSNESNWGFAGVRRVHEVQSRTGTEDRGSTGIKMNGAHQVIGIRHRVSNRHATIFRQEMLPTEVMILLSSQIVSIRCESFPESGAQPSRHPTPFKSQLRVVLLIAPSS